MAEIGYTHSMFTGNLRAYAQKVDQDTKNGGNNNGMIDGKEIELFKSLVKKETGYNFDFSNIKQSSAKTVTIQENHNFIYNNTTELAAKYKNNGASSKSIEALNGGNPFKALANKTAILPYMSEEEFAASQKEVDRQEAEVSKRIQQQKADKKAQEQKELHENTKSDWEKFCDKAKNFIWGLFN